MKIQMFQVDAFTSNLFGGNPAAVCPLNEWLDDQLLLNIAKENNLAETAFFVKDNDGFHIRWFTPEIEMDLCGHATLASAHVIFNYLNFNGDEIKFFSSSGELFVRQENGWLHMELPSRMPIETELPDIIRRGIGKDPLSVLKSRDYVLVYEREADIVKMKPDQSILNKINLDPGGIVVTAPGNKVDFVSRFFTPQATIFEDPVTGSAHSSLVPYWADRLNKNQLSALQLSDRVGELFCEQRGEKVILKGKTVRYLEGNINIPDV
jgi:predicted PhzF superfamily epimerase YddE/YHI9